jgi:hypothetical protein
LTAIAGVEKMNHGLWECVWGNTRGGIADTATIVRGILYLGGLWVFKKDYEYEI